MATPQNFGPKNGILLCHTRGDIIFFHSSRAPKIRRRRPATEITQTISEKDPFRNCNVQARSIVLKNKASKFTSCPVFPAVAMLTIIGLGFVFLLDAVVPSFFMKSIQNMAYLGPKFWGVGICVYVERERNKEIERERERKREKDRER